MSLSGLFSKTGSDRELNKSEKTGTIKKRRERSLSPRIRQSELNKSIENITERGYTTANEIVECLKNASPDIRKTVISQILQTDESFKQTDFSNPEVHDLFNVVDRETSAEVT